MPQIKIGLGGPKSHNTNTQVYIHYYVYFTSIIMKSLLSLNSKVIRSVPNFHTLFHPNFTIPCNFLLVISGSKISKYSVVELLKRNYTL